MHFVIDDLQVNWPWTKQVINLLVIYLQVSNTHMHILSGQQLIADIFKRILNEATHMLITEHGECLAWGGLPIHEDGPIPAFAGKLIDDFMAALFVYFLVGVGRPECMIIHELIPVAPLDSRPECVLLLVLDSLEWVIDIDIFSKGGGGIHSRCDFIGVMVNFPYFLILE